MTTLERTLLPLAGFALVYLTPLADLVGLSLVVEVLAMQDWRQELPPAKPA